MRVLKNPKNLGVAATFERALRIADRDIVFLCDQDDIWLPGKRAAFVAAFDAASDALAVISDAEIIDANGQVVAPSFMATRQGFDGSLLGTLWRNRYLGCSMAIRRSLLAVALPLPALAPMHDMWLGAMARTFGSVVYLPTPLLQYRRHGGNVTPATRQGLPTMIRLRMALFAAVCLRTLSCRLGIHPRLAAHTARSKAHGRATE
jgi:glycosyltransferase involved in cell wall biosynthesis